MRCATVVLKGGVVGTLMANMGLELALQTLGIPFARAKVGDRYVLEMMNEKGWRIGGENSGHIICLDQTTTGMVSSPPAGADCDAHRRDAAGQAALRHEQIPPGAGECALRRRRIRWHRTPFSRK